MSRHDHATASDPTLNRIRALLAKAENPAATPAEAEAYTAKAAELMARYGVDQAMLATDDPSSDPLVERVIDLPPPFARDKRELLGDIALELHCKVIHSTRYDSGQRVVAAKLFGHTSDMDRVELLFTSLLVQASHTLAAAQVPPGEHKAAYRRAWYAGYSAAIAGRLRAAEARAQQRYDDEHHAAPMGTRSAALVLADRAALVQRAFDEMYRDMPTVRPRLLSGSGQADGYRAGQRADLDGTRITDGAERPAVTDGTPSRP